MRRQGCEGTCSQRFSLSPSLQASRSGEFVPHKLSLKFGSLDFALTIPPQQARESVFNVQDPQINVDVALTPAERGNTSPLPSVCIIMSCVCVRPLVHVQALPLPPLQCFWLAVSSSVL